MVEQMIGPNRFTSTLAPMFLNSSRPAFSLLPDRSLSGFKPVASLSVTAAVGVCPVQISVLPLAIGAAPFIATGLPRTVSSSETVMRSHAWLALAIPAWKVTQSVPAHIAVIGQFDRDRRITTDVSGRIR